MEKLIIFDFDGVIVETELTTFKYYQELLPKYGFELKDEHFKLKAGRKSNEFFMDALGDKFDEKLVDEWVEMKRAEFIKDVHKYLMPVPGSFEFIKKAKEFGFRIALGSQNEKDLIQKAMDVFELRQYFEFLTSNQDIKNRKPDPEVFNLVLNTLKVEPKNAVVIEDSPHGIEGAIAAGTKTIGVKTSFTAEDLKRADLIIEDLTELTPERVLELLSE